MSTPTLQIADALTQPHRLVPVVAGDGAPFAALPPERREAAAETAAVRDFRGERGQTLLLAFGGEQWLLAGLGPAAEVTRPGLCEAVARGLRQLRDAGAAEVGVLVPGGLPWPAADAARTVAEAVLMGGYSFDQYRTRDVKAPPAITLAAADGERGALEAGLRAGQAVGAAVALTRDLVNHPAAVAHPDYVLEVARGVADEAGARFRQIRGEALRDAGYTALHAVGQAAATPPALAALEWGEPGPERPTLALVGKGVTFDTGGLDIKSSSAMALMKKDMGGAATVLGGFAAIAALGLPVHLVAVVGLAENAVGERSYRPGDILRTKLGPTIEITNTDAEGRVVLADAFALAREYEPRWMVDLATLTGACRVALGKELMGLFCDDEALRAALVAAGEATGDAVWPLPLWAPYRRLLDSAVADLANASTESFAGAITAALFLREFAGDVAWAHLDCYAWSDGDNPLFPKGGSGIGVRLLAELAGRLG